MYITLDKSNEVTRYLITSCNGKSQFTSLRAGERESNVLVIPIARSSQLLHEPKERRNVMGRKWTVETEGEKHLIVAEYGKSSDVADNRILVDGNEVYTWHPGQTGDLPENITIKIGDKPAVLQRKGLFTNRLELFVEGQIIRPSKR